ncbi:MAG: CHAT domain-containing protein [Nitrospirota bacterium]
MAHIAISRGHYADALREFELVLKIDERLNNKEGIALTLHNIAGVYYEIGQYDNAMKFCEKAFNLFKGINVEKHIHLSYSLFGSIYSSIGQYDKALQYYEESLKFRRESNAKHSIAHALSNVGSIYHSVGKYNEALKYREEALKIYKELNIPKGILSSYLDIGAIYLSLKDYKKAEELYRTTEKEYMKIDSTTRIGTPLIVDVYIATGKYNDALKALRNEMPPNLQDATPYRTQYYTQKGVALKGTGNVKNASEEFLKAVTLSEEMRQRVKGEKSGFFGGGSYGGRIRAYIGLVSTLAERVINGEKTDDEFASYGKDLASAVFYFSESTKARTLLEAMAKSAKKSTNTELSADIAKKENGLLTQLSAIENQWEDAYKKGEEAFKELVQRKENLKKELDSLIVLMRKEYPLYAALHYPKPIPAEELPLKENDVLIEYAITDDASYVFVVRKRGVRNLVKIPLGKEALEEKIKAFMEPLNTGKHSQFSVKASKELYNTLLADALKDIKETEKIIIVPDGILGLLPFEALVINAGKDFKDSLFVGDKWTITYTQSATALALNRMLKPSQAKKPLFALGNPVYGKEDPRYIAYKKGQQPILLAQNTDSYAYRGITIKPKEIKITDGKSDIKWEEIVYAPLPETEIEVKEIAKLFNTKPESPDILLNISANETGLKKVQLKDYRYLHFATHADLPGKVQGINEPFLLLGQVENENKDDGFLTMSEVLDMKLDADMAVLSACVTGKGKLVEGEGVANFARAFQHAGARSVVVSLWEVPSKETVEYMTAFYRYLKEGRSRAEALRLARNAIKAKYPNPFYWAPFILHGEGY